MAYLSATSDPSDGYSNHFSNGPHKEPITMRRYLCRKRKLRLYEKHIS